MLEQKDFYGEVYIHKAGTIIEEPQDPVAEEEKKPKKKKGILQKIKDKIKGKKSEPKVIEVTTEGANVVDITTKTIDESPEANHSKDGEAVSDGNNNSNE